MDTFTAITPKGINQFTFDPLVKNSTYAFLHFVPEKESPEKLKMIVSLLEKDNTLLDERNFVLEIDSSRKNYHEHHIGLLQNGKTQKMIFTALNPENDEPIEKVSIGIAVVKIKDDDDDGGNYLSPISPPKLKFDKVTL